MTGPSRRRRTRRLATVVVLTAGLLALVALNLSMGAVAIPASEVVGALARRVGLEVGPEPGPGVEAVVWTLRTPRVALAVVVGGGIAAAGVVLQGLFRNPLADPQLLGIGPGSAIGAVLGAVIGGAIATVIAGAVAGLVTALFVRHLARRSTGDPARFILIGVALGTALIAWVGFIVFASDRSTVPPMEFWLLGSLSAATWRLLGATFLIIGTAVAIVAAMAHTLDVMALGEREAGHLGVNVRFVGIVLLAAVGALTGASVGAVGVVGFVGLVVPNALRAVVGPSHRFLLLASIVGGAGMLLAADLVARTLLSPTEVAVGLVTALVGGPFLLVMLSRARLA